MWNCSRIFAGKVALLSMVAFGYLLLPSEAVAQEENTKKPFEKPYVEENSSVPEAGAAATGSIQKPTGVKVVAPLPLPKRKFTLALIFRKENPKRTNPLPPYPLIFFYTSWISLNRIRIKKNCQQTTVHGSQPTYLNFILYFLYYPGEKQLFATNKISVFFLFNQREKSLTQILWKNSADQRSNRQRITVHG